MLFQIVIETAGKEKQVLKPKLDSVEARYWRIRVQEMASEKDYVYTQLVRGEVYVSGGR